jgi:hypothetical protein
VVEESLGPGPFALAILGCVVYAYFRFLQMQSALG